MALADREQLLQQNYYLQNKIAEYFRKKKSDERQDYEKNVTDQEQRYLKYMGKKIFHSAVIYLFFSDIGRSQVIALIWSAIDCK